MFISNGFYTVSFHSGSESEVPANNTFHAVDLRLSIMLFLGLSDSCFFCSPSFCSAEPGWGSPLISLGLSAYMDSRRICFDELEDNGTVVLDADASLLWNIFNVLLKLRHTLGREEEGWIGCGIWVVTLKTMMKIWFFFKFVTFILFDFIFYHAHHGSNLQGIWFCDGFWGTLETLTTGPCSR